MIMNELKIEKNVNLSKYASIGVGGISSYVIKTDSVNQLIEALKWARKRELPYKVIGLGTNILISDKGFDGVVIINRKGSFQVDPVKSQVISDAGIPLSKLILESATNGLSGLEELYGIPGSVGGAVAVNAGANGKSIGSKLISVMILDQKGEIKKVLPDWLKLEYRGSILKNQKKENPIIILNAVFQFQKKKSEDILLKIREYSELKKTRQPIGEKTCGSIFKNPSGSDFETNIREKSAGYLLEQSGAKKMSVGQAVVSKKHANWIINKGEAKGSQIRILIEKMRNAVADKYGVNLEEEVEYMGNWS